MQWLQETTEWSDATPNHIYYMNDSRSHAVGYIKSGTTELYRFVQPIALDLRRRRFVVLQRKAERDEVYFPRTSAARPVKSVVQVETRTVAGSRPGVVYTLSKTADSWSCTCPGYTFRRRCKHTEGVTQ